MALASLTDLVRFKRGGKEVGWPVGYPVEGCVKFRSPADQVDAALGILVWSVEHSLVMLVHGLDDNDLTENLMERLKNPRIYVQLTLEHAGGQVREDLLMEYAQMPSNSVAWVYPVVGTEFVIDGLDTVAYFGKTLTVTREPMIAFETRTQLDLIHEFARTKRGK